MVDPGRAHVLIIGSLPPSDASSLSTTSVLTLTVTCDRDAGAAVLAAVQGRTVIAAVADEGPLFDSLYSDLRRLGSVEVRRGPQAPSLPAMPPECQEVLALLAAGLSLGVAATRLHISRRTADRRLAQAREALGVRTSVEAVLAYREWAQRN